MSHRGYLKKKSGGVLGNFQSRFCVLDNNALSYFKTESSPSPQGVIALATARLDTTSSKLKFALVCPGRTYDFTAATEADRAEYEEFYASSGADADAVAAAAGSAEEESPEDDDVDADGDHDEL